MFKIDFPWDLFINSLDKYSLSLMDKEGYGKISIHAKKTIMSGCHIGLLRHILDLKVSDSIVNLIIKNQHDNGLVIDSNFDKTANNYDYLNLQTTYFSRQLLRELGKINELKTINIKDILKNDPNTWLKNLDWDNPWDCCNDIMFILDFCLNPPTNKINFRKGVEILYLLKDFFNEKKGLWGTEKSDLLSDMCGSMHLYPFYKHFLPFALREEVVLKSTLKLQSCGGSFYPIWGGGACPDYDGISSIDWLDKDKKHSSNMSLAFSSISTSITPDALFVEAKRLLSDEQYKNTPKNLKKWMESNIHYYSGCKNMKYLVDEPNIWACYFRVLSIAHIFNYFNIKHPVKFLKYPGLGWNTNYNLVKTKRCYKKELDLHITHHGTSVDEEYIKNKQFLHFQDIISDQIVKVENDLLVDKYGEVVDTHNKKHFFVFDCCANFFIMDENAYEERWFYHSNILYKNWPISAGRAIVKKGKVIYLDEASGHFKPKDRLNILIDYLTKEGNVLELSEVLFSEYDQCKTIDRNLDIKTVDDLMKTYQDWFWNKD